MGRDLPLLGPHDVGHACVTTGRRGFSTPTLLGRRGLKFLASPIGVFVPSIPITLEPVNSPISTLGYLLTVGRPMIPLDPLELEHAPLRREVVVLAYLPCLVFGVLPILLFPHESHTLRSNHSHYQQNALKRHINIVNNYRNFIKIKNGHSS